MVLSVTSQGEISSMLLLFDVLFFIFFAEVPLKEFLFSLLLITCELLPLLNRDSDLFLLIFLFTEFLFAFEPERLRLEARTGSLLLDCCCPGFLPTLDRDLVTGWLLANDVSILLSVEVLESLSDVGSKDASGELLGDPVDMGEGDDAGAGAAELGTVGAAGAEPSRRSKNGFLLLLGDENGFVLPIVANFCPVLNGLLLSEAG